MVNGRPGLVPQTAKRNEFTRLIAEGLSIAEAVRRRFSSRQCHHDRVRWGFATTTRANDL